MDFMKRFKKQRKPKKPPKVNPVKPLDKSKKAAVSSQAPKKPKPPKIDIPKPFTDGHKAMPMQTKPQKLADYEKEFLHVFKELTYRYRSWDVWQDFIVMAACALSNPLDNTHYEEREARYLHIVEKYSKAEQQLFPELFAYVVMALEKNPEQDFLGKLYMSLNLYDEGRQQHFTPYSVCQLMADVTLDNCVEEVREKGFVTLNDCCCGAGATLIAAVHAAKRSLEKEGLNFQNHILVTAQDIDETVALMCYIQLSLLGVAAYIKVGDALTEPMTEHDSTKNYWFTPMYFSDIWSMRRLMHQTDRLLRGEGK